MHHDRRSQFDKDIDGLKELFRAATAACEQLRLLLSAVRSNDRFAAVQPIATLLDSDGRLSRFKQLKDAHGHLLHAVDAETEFPARPDSWQEAIDSQRPPSLNVRRRTRSAHFATFLMSLEFGQYLASNVQDIFSQSDWPVDPYFAAESLIRKRWPEVCKHLADVAKFDTDDLFSSVKSEYEAAIEYSRRLALESDANRSSDPRSEMGSPVKIGGVGAAERDVSDSGAEPHAIDERSESEEAIETKSKPKQKQPEPKTLKIIKKIQQKKSNDVIFTEMAKEGEPTSIENIRKVRSRLESGEYLIKS